MKYTKSESKKIAGFNHEIESIDKKAKKELARFDKQIEIHGKKINALRKLKTREERKISTINMRVKKRCKHLGDRKKWRNMRDDASFDYFVACKDCDEILWKECK